MSLILFGTIQYIPRNMHTVFALLCFVVVIHWLIFPYPSGLLHWHCGNLTIAPVPAKQPWWIWINTSCEFIMNDCITTTKQSTTKPCAYFLGYTVCTWESTSAATYKLESWSINHFSRIHWDLWHTNSRNAGSSREILRDVLDSHLMTYSETLIVDRKFEWKHVWRSGGHYACWLVSATT